MLGKSEEKGSVPVEKDTTAQVTMEQDSDGKDKILDEKVPPSRSETPEVGDGQVVIIDKDGNVDVIKETDYTEAEYKKLLRKVDRFLLPLMWFCYG